MFGKLFKWRAAWGKDKAEVNAIGPMGVIALMQKLAVSVKNGQRACSENFEMIKE